MDLLPFAFVLSKDLVLVVHSTDLQPNACTTGANALTTN